MRIKPINIVLDNIIFSLQIAGGISVYWFELITRFKIKKIEINYYKSLNNNIFSKQLPLSQIRESRIPFGILRYLPFLKKIKTPTILHSSYYRFSFQKDVANIITIYDFTYELFGSGLSKKVHVFQKKIAIKNSAGIICISENTKQDLIKFYPWVDEKKIKVIYMGVSEKFFRLQSNEHNAKFESLRGKKFVLYVGDRTPYKNFDKAVSALAKHQNLAFVIVGGKPFGRVDIDLISQLNDRVYLFKDVSTSDLNWLYNHAFCLIYPSRYEGFGLPVLEAMRAGCPVVASKLSSIPEVAGDAALLVDEPIAAEFAEKIERLYDNNCRNNLIAKGYCQVQKFSWDKCFQETVDFYQGVWESEFGETI